MCEPSFQMGQQVRVVSARHRVGAITGAAVRRQGQYWYPVFFGPGQTDILPEEDLENYTGTNDIHSMMQDGLFGGREALSRLVTQLKLTLDLRSQIYSLYASKTKFLTYQFKPLLKFLESRNHRLLIADEVGLGKTIEAGLILTELRHRRPDLARVLVVPPAHLCRKWQEEMRRRFDRHFRILDSRSVLEFLRDYERDGTETSVWGIVSLQTFRSARIMERWEEVGPQMDLVVFDEAGRLRNPETRSHRVASLVSEASDGLLLLTATPVQTGAEDLFHLLGLLEPEAFDRQEVFAEQLDANGHVLSAMSLLRSPNASIGDVFERLRGVENTALAQRFLANPIYRELMERIPALQEPGRRERIELQRDVESLSVFGHVLSRTRKRDVNEEQPERRARVWRCTDVSLHEKEFYSEVTRICREAYERGNDRRGASFGIIQPQRQMASCMVAMVEYVEARIQQDDGQQNELADIEPDEEDNGQVATGSGPQWDELGNLEIWKQRLESHDSKFSGLMDVLHSLDEEEPGAKVIVFTFFKRTAHYIKRRLAEHGINGLVLTGDTKADPDNPELDERLQTIERFRNDQKIRVMVATEVADEGLDLQFAHCMVNYDLPWNPMRIEQRIGRIDRIGQESNVIQVFNLSMPDTIEDRILELLYDRIGIFEQSIGDLESIMGEVIDDLQHDLFSGLLTPVEEARRIRQAADVIERRAQESERLQDESQALIGQDEFFIDEIERARKAHRYLSGEELIIYLRDYLAEHHRSCRLKKVVDREDVFHLRVTDELRQTVRGAFTSDDREVVRFLTRCAEGEMLFTTRPELAQEDYRLELLNFYHPLIRMINMYYEDKAAELHPVSNVMLRTNEVKSGIYAWVLYSTEISGARPMRDLELVAINLDSNDVLDEDTCEVLLWQMVAEAESVPEVRRHSGVPVEQCASAEESLVSRLNAKFENRRRANDALVANRLASLRETYERNHEIRVVRISEAKARRRKESYIRGLETRLRNLESGYHAKVAEVEGTRDMSRSYQLRGGGVVEVTNEG